MNISKTAVGSYGYATVKSLQTYFYESSDIISYIETNGVTSNLDNVQKSQNNIDFASYGILNNITGTVEQLKNHYLCYGQFERKVVPLITRAATAMDNLYQNVGTIFSSAGLATCFLITSQSNGELYLVTCHHVVVGTSDINTVYATFENKFSSTVITAAFQLAGYDIYADIYVGIFNPKLSYNLSHHVTAADLSATPLFISFDYDLNKNDKVMTVGNFQQNTNMVAITGYVMDNVYSGLFSQVTALPIPDSVLTNMIIPHGTSGAPLLVGDPFGSSPLKCVGMMNSVPPDSDKYSVAISAF